VLHKNKCNRILHSPHRAFCAVFFLGEITMIAILKNGTTDAQRDHLISWLKNMNLDVHISAGKEVTVLGLIGDTSRVDIDLLSSLEIVSSVKRISEPFKQANRKFHPDSSIITVGNAKFGGGHFSMIAGPCSVESEEQIINVAQAVKAAGADVLRGGAFKPRTSPYAFQGLKSEGLRLLLLAKEATGLPIITEIMNVRTLDLFEDVDIIQVGARNMQNFDLLQELGKTRKPILLKRGLANTLQELLMSAEYIMSEGNENIILCERGIRTFETYTRNTLDLSAVPVLHEMTHLPIVIDPSHATGKASLVPSMAVAAAACGADGIMIEVHNNPSCALCDGAQSVTPNQFAEINTRVQKVREAIK
jgi:3-deoxy-7-phosphoheptulonate synthase